MKTPEPCEHVWKFYEMRVLRCRKQRRKCNRLEDKMWFYSLRAAGI